MFNLQRNKKNDCDGGHLLKEQNCTGLKFTSKKIKLQGVYFRMREVNEGLNTIFIN